MSIEEPEAVSQTVAEPFDLVRLSVDEYVYIKCRNHRELRGKLISYDEHMNMVLADCEETFTQTEVNAETGEETSQVKKRTMPMVFMRGDAVILMSLALGN